MKIVRKPWSEILKTDVKFQKARTIGESFQTSAPAPFVGRYGYPNISMGLLCPPETGEQTWKYDAPKYWASQNYKTPQILGYRVALLNTQEKTSIKKPLQYAQLAAMASKPVDAEIKLKKKPEWALETDEISTPVGPRAELEWLRITSNPKIPSKVDKIVNDELTADAAIMELSVAGFDETYLSRLLSVGTLGINKKLVPTRWSITATDDVISKQQIQKIKEYRQTEYAVYYGNYLGNYYLIIMLAGKWQYELFEMAVPVIDEVEVSTDYESYFGRTGYSQNCTGGYYSVRLAVTEKLEAIKRQASCTVFRFVTQEYDTPLGVWVTREAARNALKNQPIYFANKADTIKHAKMIAMHEHNLNIQPLLEQSKTLKETQTDLFNYELS